MCASLSRPRCSRYLNQKQPLVSTLGCPRSPCCLTAAKSRILACTRRSRSACAALNVVWHAARRVHMSPQSCCFVTQDSPAHLQPAQRPSAQTGSHAGEPVRKDWGKKTPARRTHICQGCPFRPLLVRRTVSDESDTKEGKNSAYLSLRNLLPQPLLPLAGLGREVLPEIR